MKAPFERNQNQPSRIRSRPKTLRDLKRRRKQAKMGEHYHTIWDRMFYAVIASLLYAFLGFLIDGFILFVRSALGVGDGSIYWLFTPFLFVIGAIIGFLDGKFAGADSFDLLPFNSHTEIDENNLSFRHDLLRGLGWGIFIFAIIWLILMIML